MTTHEGSGVELDRLQRELNDVFGRWGISRSAAEFPPINVWTNDDGAMLLLELPGLDPGKIEISVLGDALTVKGERAEPPREEGRTFHRRERGFGAFNRTIQLAFRIDPAKVKATYRRGLLEIAAPRADEDRPRSIQVTAG